MKNRIITISRQFGSGGRTIGKEVAEKLGIHCYDSELIQKAAENSGYAEEFIKERGEHSAYKGLFAHAFADRGRDGMSTQDRLWIVQQDIIKEIAEKESCVIVGRCADYILKDLADCLTVFVHADMDKRMERIVNLYGEGKDTPEKRIRDKDKRRSAYYHFYTDMKWGAAENYHITLNSGVLGIEKCVDIIADLY